MRETVLGVILAALFPAFLSIAFTSCKGNAPQTQPSQAPRTVSAQPGPPGPAAVGAMAPDITVYGKDGNQVKLSALRGNVVLINFWATWCGSCDSENPGLNRLYARLKRLPHFKLLSVLYGDSRQNADNYLTAHSYHIQVYADPDGRAAAAYGLTGVPESYLVDKNGLLRGKAIGPEDWDNPKIPAFIEKLAKE